MRNEWGTSLNDVQTRRRLYPYCDLIYLKHFDIAPPRWDKCFFIEYDGDCLGNILVLTTARERVSISLEDTRLPPSPRM